MPWGYVRGGKLYMNEQSDEFLCEVEDAIEAPGTSYTPPVQSADTLFHFVDKLEYLLSIIDHFAIVPRYCTEDIDYLRISMNKIAYPMLCFCDINLHKMQEHISFYGGYGIAFSKKWGIDKGIQPVQYMNPKSILKDDFKKAFEDSLHDETEDSAQNFLLSQMYYLKAIDGTMERNGVSVHKNFTDECEWRFIPDVKPVKLPQAITEEEIFSKDTWNKALTVSEVCWLKFSADDVKYIILNSEEEFDKVVEVIERKGLDARDSKKLFSKILIWSEIRRPAMKSQA